jgi:nitrogen-specific signal transduction histidine kinase/ActR/RegA family two-component response regulator
MVRTFVEDTRRSAARSARLAGEVQERTEERDRAQSALVQSEQLVALGRLAAGVGHEINNPLAYLLVSLEEARAGLASRDVPPPVLEALLRAEDGARRIERVVQGLRAYSRNQSDRRPVDLHAVVRHALRVAGPNLRHTVRIDVDLRPTPAVLGDESRLVQACVNLLVNAAQAAADNPAGGVVTVRTADDAGAHGVLSIADNGPGVAPEAMGRLGEPYFTTRARDGGLGLGLFVTRGIIDAHGGDLQFSSTVGRGTAVTVRLPAVEPGAIVASEPAPAPPVAAAPRPRRRVLLVDDDEMVSAVLSQALGRRHDVTVATSAKQALACIGRESFDAVICDVMMPEMSGMELAAAIESSHPALRRRMLFLTGGAVTPAAEAFLARPDVRYAMKPVGTSDLHAAIDDLASASDVSR